MIPLNWMLKLLLSDPFRLLISLNRQNKFLYNWIIDYDYPRQIELQLHKEISAICLEFRGSYIIKV